MDGRLCCVYVSRDEIATALHFGVHQRCTAPRVLHMRNRLRRNRTVETAERETAQCETVELETSDSETA